MKFLSLKVDNHLNWKNHIEQMIPHLSAACYAFRSSVHISSVYTQINLLCTLLFCYKIWNNFGGATLPTVGIFSRYKRISELLLVHSPESPGAVCI
jgi:hypothetical protein